MPRQKRLQQQLLQNKTPSQLSEVDDDESYDTVEIDLHRGFSRPKLITVNLWDDDTELPEHITKRLENARIKALMAYHSKYTNDFTKD
jgi:hypothetical protein